ncbi:hypothetical protein H5410_022799 [Solanum commersonii]|uniref:Uncharacterized protein n=1 Tax=Solanum commersonii TaxID=4109 RepID=A0A9J5ZJQ3_SOLCO|nr:hypothetical protein H5410_022799 [Solanum commersonii]
MKINLAKNVYLLLNSEGAGLAPFDCWLCLRSIKMMVLSLLLSLLCCYYLLDPFYLLKLSIDKAISPLPNAMICITLKELFGGAHNLLPVGLVHSWLCLCGAESQNELEILLVLERPIRRVGSPTRFVVMNHKMSLNVQFGTSSK